MVWSGKDPEPVPMSSDPVINYDKMLLEEGVGKLDKDNGIWTCEQTGHVIFWVLFPFDKFSRSWLEHGYVQEVNVFCLAPKIRISA